MAKLNVNGRIIDTLAGESLLGALQREGVRGVDAPCGGNGVCGKCLVRVTGTVTVNGETIEADNAELRACRTVPVGDCTVSTNGADMVVLEGGTGELVTDGGEGLAVAVDIGTTTVAVYLYRMADGERLGVKSGVNFQRAYGADVISRISYADRSAGGLEKMRDMIRGQIDGYITELCESTGSERCRIKSVAVAGNTVMEHIFTGLSPSGIGVAPFKPESLFGYTAPARELGMELDAEVYITNAVAGYVGGDITAGILASGMYRSEKPCIFLDIGTNGEMAIGGKNGMLCCATAAGPAFEGAELQYGMSGVEGAVSKVKFEGGELICSVIGGGKAAGICGSGYIDALAAMLDMGAMDETGRLLDLDEAEETALKYLDEDEDGNIRFKLADGVYITQADVRKLQLAKAAIRAGLDLLLADTGTKEDDVETMFLAGGFGNFIDCVSAGKIGLLPASLVKKTLAVGNAAGAGASMAALSGGARRLLDEITASCRYSELSEHKGFSDAFMEAMTFEEI